MSAQEANLRAADSDRERAVQLLRRHHDAGRLDHDDLEERLQAVYHARTYGDLDRLFADLPLLPSPRPPLPGRPLAQPAQAGGRRSFAFDGVVDGDPGTAARRVARQLEPVLRRSKYVLASSDEDHLVFTSRRIAGWAWPVALVGVPFTIGIAVVPVSLLLLLVKQEDRVTLEFVPTGDGRTRVVARGVAARRVRQGLAELTG